MSQPKYQFSAIEGDIMAAMDADTKSALKRWCVDFYSIETSLIDSPAGCSNPGVWFTRRQPNAVTTPAAAGTICTAFESDAASESAGIAS